MAPLEASIEDRQHQHGFNGVKRNDAVSGASQVNAMPPQGASLPGDDSAASTSTIYLGIGLGVGGAFLVGVIFVAVLIVRKWREHKQKIEAMEVEEALQSAQRQHTREMVQPRNVAGCNAFNPLHARSGWEALSSNETVNEPEPIARVDRRKRSSVSLPKKFKQRGIPLKRLKRLTAILESPSIRNSPSLPVLEALPAVAAVESSNEPQSNRKAYNLPRANEDDVFVCPGSPKPEVLPSFAIQSPGRYGGDIANNSNRRAYRSRSVGTMLPIPNDALFGSSSRLGRLPAHSRSMSLGAPSCRPPSGPVPPLPVIQPHAVEVQDGARQGVCVSRMSSSSQDSAGSSALVATPILMITEQDQPTKSPSVEEVVSNDDSASLKAVNTNRWRNPLVTGPRPVTGAPTKADSDPLTNHASIRSNIARYSAESLASHRMSSVSVASSDSLRKRISLAQIGVADSISISRVSSENSLQSFTGVRKITTPRKASRTSVSEAGSPAERRKTSVLRDISGNSIGPSRQPSNATQDSSRSSNGNPFQWDQPLPKPSALKGSPNARKGHRRQNCVRISTLTPQILGPPPSRPTSPSIMHGIEEESGDGDELDAQPGARFVSNQRFSRPSSASYFAPNPRLQTLRASLTPSSPTLSVWTAFQEYGLPSQVSDSQLSVSAGTRSVSRQSNRSSIHTIPSFPSPVKAAVATTQLSQPVPEFYLSRPSTDFDENDSSSPSGSRFVSEPNMPSSPPSAVPEQQEYDPAHPPWPTITIPAPDSGEYDPASPAWDDTDLERSSGFFPFAMNSTDQATDNDVSAPSRPVSYGGDLPDTPPISPKTMPEGFQAFFDKTDAGSKPSRASEKLTSANASAVMARSPPSIDFPGAPVLARPSEDEAFAQMAAKSYSPRHRAVSTATYLVPMRAPPPPPVPPKDRCIPSPLHISGKTCPSGPRTQPAHSVLKNAMALRKMNSEVNTIGDRESRRFVRLGREASPLLPWIGSPNPNDSCATMNELFDFDFAADTTSGAEEHSALENVDMNEMVRKLDGALAGFDALPCDNDRQQARSLSIWDDGEKYWEQDQSPHIGYATSSPPPPRTTPRKQNWDSPRSIQMTPKSLYDSDGFLRT